MLTGIPLAAGLLGGVWWLARGARRARRLYRHWRYLNSIIVYGDGQPGRAWVADAALAAALALAGPLLSERLEAGRCWRGVRKLILVAWFATGAPPLDGVWR